MINAKISLYTHQKETLKGFPIKLYISDGKIKKIKYLHLKIYSSKKHWNDKANEPKKTHPNYWDVLAIVNQWKHKYPSVIIKANQNKWSLEKTFSQLNDNYSEISFNQFWNNLNLEFYKNGLAKYRTYKSHFDIFNKYNPNVQFDNISYHFLCQFRDFKMYDNGKSFSVSEEEKEKIKLCLPSGIHSILRSVRAVYNEAISREVYEPNQYKSPFKGVFPTLSKTPNKSLSIPSISKIYNNKPELSTQSKSGGYYHYRNYFIVSFGLGGVDLIDIANLRYDKHVVEGRVVFQRFKQGETKEIISNYIFPEIWEILNEYDCKPYLFPIHATNDYVNFRNNFINRFRIYLNKIGVTKYFSSKSARYSFINIGKQLQLNRDILMELTGHSRGDVHSIYESGYSYEVKDEVHRKILDAVFKT